MTLDELLKSRRIRPQDVSNEDVKALFGRAEEDLTASAAVLSQSAAWAYTIAYNAALQAGRAFVFSQGYRSASHEAHKNTFMFLRAVLEEEHQQTVNYFDSVRVKRHKAVYEAAVQISERDARGLLDQARIFVQMLKQKALS